MEKDLFNSLFKNIFLFRIIFKHVKSIHRNILLLKQKNNEIYTWDQFKKNHNCILIKYNQLDLFKEFIKIENINASNREKSVIAQDKKNSFCIATAIVHSRFNFLDYFINDLKWHIVDHYSSASLLNLAIQTNRLDTILYLERYLISLQSNGKHRQHNRVYYNDRGFTKRDCMLNLSISIGNLEIFKWIYKRVNKLEISNDVPQMITECATNGYLDTLKWFKSEYPASIHYNYIISLAHKHEPIIEWANKCLQEEEEEDE